MSHPEASAEGLTQANTDDSRQVYEVGFHVVPTIAEAEVGGVVDAIHSELTPLAAEIIKEEFPHKLALAYTIERSSHGKREKYSEAYFGWIKFATEPENIPALMEKLRAMKEVLRFLCVETVREDAQAPRRAVFTSDRLEGETIKKPAAATEQGGEVSEEELNKSIDALVS